MRSPILAAGSAVLVSAASLLALAQGTAAASGTTQKEVKGVGWSASHSSATASGTRWTEKGSSFLFSDLVIKGELKNTGSGCTSVWTQWTHDFAGMPAVKIATQCGPGTSPVNYRLASYSPTTTGSLFVCEGDKDTHDCGRLESMTSWPIRSTR
ncbi:hypothetical protein AB0H73_33325 [Streptomyces olivoreticuli]